jgi:hypothetical protein
MIKFNNVKVHNYYQLKKMLGFLNINHSLYINVTQSDNDSRAQIKIYMK